MQTAIDDLAASTAVEVFLAAGVTFHHVADPDGVLSVVHTDGLSGHDLPDLTLVLLSNMFTAADASAVLGYLVATHDDLHDGLCLQLEIFDGRCCCVKVMASDEREGEMVIVQVPQIPAHRIVSRTLH